MGLIEADARAAMLELAEWSREAPYQVLFSELAGAWLLFPEPPALKLEVLWPEPRPLFYGFTWNRQPRAEEKGEAM